MNRDNITFYDVAEIVATKIIGFGISAFILSGCRQSLTEIGWKAIIIGVLAFVLALIFVFMNNLKHYRDKGD